MFCPQCRSRIDMFADRCPKCGKSFEGLSISERQRLELKPRVGQNAVERNRKKNFWRR